MPKQSAGILVYRPAPGGLEVLLVHPGGPFWARKDLGAWSIPKGEFEQGQDPLDAAKREFLEETGVAPKGAFMPLGTARQPGGKVVHVWAMAADIDPSAIKSNTFSMEWPPRSGSYRQFPEIDKAEWFPVEVARQKINKGQIPFIDRLFQSRGTVAESDT